ncbi:ty3-gypsy retrotransposon protein [Tanacetum coccineum]|uniref:Ty3-gypsy retrotransposon protein n=1 Tax=Tanacetum coccineum TaxID=301880 RepID=A0ABQ5CB86_9ASTR
MDWPVLKQTQGENEALAFETLKTRLSTSPLLSLPNFDHQFVIEADASDDGVGAVLIQNARPISFFSRKLGPRMRVAATYQNELFAIVEAIYKWRQYLMGRRISGPLANQAAVYALSRMFEDDERSWLHSWILSRGALGSLNDLRMRREVSEGMTGHGASDVGEIKWRLFDFTKIVYTMSKGFTVIQVVVGLRSQTLYGKMLLISGSISAGASNSGGCKRTLSWERDELLRHTKARGRSCDEITLKDSSRLSASGAPVAVFWCLCDSREVLHNGKPIRHGFEQWDNGIPRRKATWGMLVGISE